MGCSFTSKSYGTVSQAGHTQPITFVGNYWDDGYNNYWDGFRWDSVYDPPTANEYPYNISTGKTGYFYSGEGGGENTLIADGATRGNYDCGGPLVCDTTYYVRSFQYRSFTLEQGHLTTSTPTYSFKTYAVDPTVGTPTLSGATSSQIVVNANWTPATVATTVTVYVQYKKTSDSTWSTWSSNSGTGTGYTSRAITETTITGLVASTSYDFRIYVDRTDTTNPTKTYTGAVTSLSTSTAAPTITTVAASSIGETTAVLNATVDPNDISTVVTFEWDTNTGTPYANTTTSAGTFTGDGDQAAAKTITGLTASTTYYFRAVAGYGNDIVYGSELNFATTVNPGVAAKACEMLPVLTFDRKYGVATTIYFAVPIIAATSSDTLYTGAAVWAAANESRISKDGGAWADTTADPAAVGSAAGLYSLALSATEMACDEGFVLLHDVGGAVRDVLLHVRTHLQLGSAIIDAATGTKANTTALTLTGYGSGSGLVCTAGATGKDIDGIFADMVLRTGVLAAVGATSATLDSGAPTTADYFNGAILAIVSGTGVGQARIISDYSTGRACTVAAWSTQPTGATYIITPGPDVWLASPGVELAALPDQTSTSTGTYGKLLQFLFQRFAYQRYQDATQQIMHKADGITALATATFVDNTTDQTIGKSA